MTDRPDRLSVTDELGAAKTLPQGTEHYHAIARGEPLLLLGLGPAPAEAVGPDDQGRTVYYVEAPEFKSQMPPSWARSIPIRTGSPS